MANKTPDSPRMLTCLATGAKFPYSGKGRPPKYSPAAKADVLKSQRQDRQKKAKR